MKIEELYEVYSTGITTFEHKMIEKYQLKSFHLYDSKDYITLNALIVNKDSMKQGTGTKVMNELTDFADSLQKRIVLTTGQRDPNHGTTSASRLKTFYKRFGFVENKGRNKDFSISGNMFRDPQ